MNFILFKVNFKGFPPTVCFSLLSCFWIFIWFFELVFLGRLVYVF